MILPRSDSAPRRRGAALASMVPGDPFIAPQAQALDRTHTHTRSAPEAGRRRALQGLSALTPFREMNVSAPRASTALRVSHGPHGDTATRAHIRLF